MYKVFIDQRPLVLIERDKFSGIHKNILFYELNNTVKDFKSQLKDATVDDPLYVLCDDVAKAFESLFGSFKKIRAAGGIVKRKNKFLVIKRNGKWDIPKGKIDKGEGKKAAAIREIEEECGIERPEIQDFLVTTEGITKAKWMTEEEMLSIRGKTYGSINEVLDAYLRSK